MIDSIYVESDVREHPRAQAIIARHRRARIIECTSYRELFNRRRQNFRVQKSRPALILAAKPGPRLHPVPPGQHLGAARNYYFSHLLNCPFDCRYCFLQGMFASANYVLFVNYEAFVEDIVQLAAADDSTVHFFSGYDCDSLALEPMTGFAGHFVQAFAGIRNAVLELRTKSTQIRSLLAQPAHDRCIVAVSLAPAAVAARFERGAPGLEERLDALARLQAHGWPIGLRFDPLVDFRGAGERYADFFRHVFAVVDPDSVHSVTLGAMRLPREFAKRMVKLYPDEALFAAGMSESGGLLTSSGADELLARAHALVSQHISPRRIFVQHSFGTAPAEESR